MILVYPGWSGYWRYRFHKAFKAATVAVFITSVITTQIAGLDSYKFRIGTEAVIPFSFPLEEHPEYGWEMFRFGASQPFNNNGTTQPNALNPNQRNRFQINCTWGTDILGVKLIIQNISEIDSGVYIWAVQQYATRTKRLVSSFDARVDIIRPPGRVNCTIKTSPYSKRLREVHCYATVGSDGGGQLICYQNNEKTPFQSPPQMSATHVTAVFWMDGKNNISCCSHEANFEKDPEHCNGFTEAAFSEPPSTKSVTRKLTTPRMTDIIRTKKAATAPYISTNTEIEPTSTVCNNYLKQNNRLNLHMIYNFVYLPILLIELIVIMILFRTRRAKDISPPQRGGVEIPLTESGNRM